MTTLRYGFEPSALDSYKPTMLLLSPGPGRPKDFALSRTIELALQRRIPLCGVCLGLQGLIEHYGGELGVLPYPMHGKPSTIVLSEPRGALFDGLPNSFQARPSRPAARVATALVLHSRGRRYGFARALPERRHGGDPCSSPVLLSRAPLPCYSPGLCVLQVGRYHSLYSLPNKHPKELRVTARTEDGTIMAIQHETLPIAAVQFHPESIITPTEVGLQILANAVNKLSY